jgi:hypothetical protein
MFEVVEIGKMLFESPTKKVMTNRPEKVEANMEMYGYQPLIMLGVGKPEESNCLKTLVDSGAQASAMNWDCAAFAIRRTKALTNLSDDVLVLDCYESLSGIGGQIISETKINVLIHYHGVWNWCQCLVLPESHKQLGAHMLIGTNAIPKLGGLDHLLQRVEHKELMRGISETHRYQLGYSDRFQFPTVPTEPSAEIAEKQPHAAILGFCRAMRPTVIPADKTVYVKFEADLATIRTNKQHAYFEPSADVFEHQLLYCYNGIVSTAKKTHSSVPITNEGTMDIIIDTGDIIGTIEPVTASSDVERLTDWYLSGKLVDKTGKAPGIVATAAAEYERQQKVKKLANHQAHMMLLKGVNTPTPEIDQNGDEIKSVFRSARERMQLPHATHQA